MTTVYIDRQFLFSFLINFALLYVTAKISRSRVKASVLAIGAAVCALYTAGQYIPYINRAYGMPLNIIFSIFTVYIVFKFKSIVSFIKILAVFYLVTFAFAGCVYAAMNFFGENNIYLLIISFVLAYFIVTIATFYAKKRTANNSCIQKMTISYNGKSVTVPCMHDTGNGLCEPLSGSPAIVVSMECITELLPADMLIRLLNKKYSVKFKIIPYTSLGNSGAYMLGFKPDKVTIEGKEVESCYIAVYEKRISKDDSYRALYGNI